MNEDTDGCPGTNRNGEPCGHPSGWGTDRDDGPCKFHGGAADNRGEKNGNYKHGAYSKHLRSDLSDREREAMDDLVGDLEDEEASLDVVREMAAEAALKYKRCGDHRFLREFRQLVSEFNLAPNEDHVELQAEVESEHSLDDETREAVREVLSHRREASNE